MSKNIFFLSIPIFFFSLACSLPFGDGRLSSRSPSNESIKISEEDRLIMLQLVNDLRQNGCLCGNTYMPPTSPLQLHEKLNQTAQQHAEDMYTKQFFGHRGSDGSRVSDRAERAGYDWQNIGENISAGYPNVQAAYEGWRNSSDHCKNMMADHFQNMGLARKGEYWVQTLGTLSN
jgi:uncharacterized protein YkwD